MNGMIEATEAIGATAMPARQVEAASTAVPGFADWVSREVEAMNTQLLSAEHGVQRLATGQADNLHDVMLQLEQSRLTLQLATQVRTRLLEAYQDVMKMQV